MPACDLKARSLLRNRPAGRTERLVVTWQHPDERGIQPIGFLSYDDHVYSFSYIQNALSVRDFRPLLGFEDLYEVYESTELFPLFAQRVMAPRRPDYQRYVEQLGLEGEPDPWEQITRSQGHRQGDSLQLLPEPITKGHELSGLFLAHGVRHVASESHELGGREIQVTRAEVEGALSKLRRGDSLAMVPEPANPMNQRALMLTTSDMIPVGWVPDLLLEDIYRLQESARVTVAVEHVNPNDAPWHLRLLVRLKASPVADYRFFTGDRWDSLAMPTHQ